MGSTSFGQTQQTIVSQSLQVFSIVTSLLVDINIDFFNAESPGTKNGLLKKTIKNNGLSQIKNQNRD